MLLLIGSVGVVGYAVSTMAAFIVEGEFQRALRGRIMDRRIAKLQNHVVLCGGGPTGKFVADELQKNDTPLVVIERDPEAIRQLLQLGDILHLEGDATLDETLSLAGIERARGLIAVLGEDKEERMQDHYSKNNLWRKNKWKKK